MTRRDPCYSSSDLLELERRWDKVPVSPKLPEGIALSVELTTPLCALTVSRAGQCHKRADTEKWLLDAAGRLAKTLVRGASMPGAYTTRLAASQLARGVYILTYRSGDYEAVRKLIIE